MKRSQKSYCISPQNTSETVVKYCSCAAFGVSTVGSVLGKRDYGLVDKRDCAAFVEDAAK